MFLSRTVAYWISKARLSYRLWLSHPRPGLCDLKLFYPINQNDKHFRTQKFNKSHKDS